MHGSVLAWLRTVKAHRPELFCGVRVLECGSYDINGSARPLFEDCEYIGLDWRPGPGVDVVSLVHQYRPAAPFDVVVSTEMLEHDPHWVGSLWSMTAALRPGGSLLLTWATPARDVHEVDCAPKAGHYQGLQLAEVVKAIMPWYEEIEAQTARGNLDAYLAAYGRLIGFSGSGWQGDRVTG
jgi:hypothetical protein